MLHICYWGEVKIDVTKAALNNQLTDFGIYFVKVSLPNGERRSRKWQQV